jgi:hypothetical protein
MLTVHTAGRWGSVGLELSRVGVAPSGGAFALSWSLGLGPGVGVSVGAAPWFTVKAGRTDVGNNL